MNFNINNLFLKTSHHQNKNYQMINCILLLKKNLKNLQKFIVKHSTYQLFLIEKAQAHFKKIQR